MKKFPPSSISNLLPSSFLFEFGTMQCPYLLFQETLYFKSLMPRQALLVQTKETFSISHLPFNPDNTLHRSSQNCYRRLKIYRCREVRPLFFFCRHYHCQVRFLLSTNSTKLQASIFTVSELYCHCSHRFFGCRQPHVAASMPRSFVAAPPTIDVATYLTIDVVATNLNFFSLAFVAT